MVLDDGNDDGDGVSDAQDNCQADYNALQEDTYSPQGNSCGDAGECEKGILTVTRMWMYMVRRSSRLISAEAS